MILLTGNFNSGQWVDAIQEGAFDGLDVLSEMGHVQHK